MVRFAFGEIASLSAGDCPVRMVWMCPSVPVKYYTLSPLAAAGEVTSEKEMAGRDLVIGIGPVRLPSIWKGKKS